MLVDVQNLRKEYGPLVAVKDVSFSIEPGQVVGLIGPNGAGKTTLLKMLATLLEPTDGQIRVLGHDAHKNYLAIRGSIGYLPDFFGLYEDLTIAECLTFFANTYKVPAADIPARVDNVLEAIQLTEKRDDYVQNLSRGMIQRLGLGVLLVHEPALFLLDEPASGLDPKARIDLRKVLTGLSQKGKSVLISSHILTELADFCTHVMIMDHGRFLAQGKIDDILAQLDSVRKVRITVLNARPEAEKIAATFGDVMELTDSGLTVGLSGDLEQIAHLNTALVQGSVQVVSLYEEKTNLEDMFLKIAGA